MSLVAFQKEHVRKVIAPLPAKTKQALADMHIFLASCCASGFCANVHADLAQLYGAERPDLGKDDAPEDAEMAALL